MSPALRLQMERQKGLIAELSTASKPIPDIRDQIIEELRTQLKDAQDKPYIDDTLLIGVGYSPPILATWLNNEPEDDNGDYARGLRI